MRLAYLIYAPELQGGRLDRTDRTANHDAFGLAVMAFQLLFMGRHPFVGGFLGGSDMPMERAIEEFRFAYSSDRNRTRMEAPPHVPSLGGTTSPRTGERV